METTTALRRTEIAGYIHSRYGVYIPIDSDVSVSNIFGLFLERKYFVPSTIIEYIYHMFYVKFKCDDKKHRYVKYQELYMNVISYFKNHILEKLIEMFKINMDDNVSLAIGIYYIVINDSDRYDGYDKNKHDKHNRKIIKYLTHSSLFGNYYASCFLGRYLKQTYNNNNIYNREERIIRLFLHSINNGNVPEAMFSYAELCTDGLYADNIETEKQIYKKYCLHTKEQLLQYCKLAAKNGIIEACYDVGLYFIDNGYYAKGIKYIIKGIGYGSVDCITELKILIKNIDVFIGILARIYHNTAGNTRGKKAIISKLFHYVSLKGIILNTMHHKIAIRQTYQNKLYKLGDSLKTLISLCETAISEKIKVSFASFILGVAYSDTNKDLAIKYYHTYIDDADRNTIDFWDNIKLTKMYCEKFNDTTLMKKLQEYE